MTDNQINKVMDKIKFKASSIIEAVKVVKETAQTVTYLLNNHLPNTGTERKESRHHKYFDTFAEAQKWLIQTKEAEARKLEIQAVKIRSRLEGLKKISEQEVIDEMNNSLNIDYSKIKIEF